MSASAFSLTLCVPVDGLAVTSGEATVGREGEGLTHVVCAACHTWLFTRVEGAPFVNLRVTMLDEAGWYAPFVETHTREGLAWARTPAVHSYEAVPEREAWGAVIAEHAEWARARGWPVP